MPDHIAKASGSWPWSREEWSHWSTLPGVIATSIGVLAHDLYLSMIGASLALVGVAFTFIALRASRAEDLRPSTPSRQFSLLSVPRLASLALVPAAVAAVAFWFVLQTNVSLRSQIPELQAEIESSGRVIASLNLTVEQRDQQIGDLRDENIRLAALAIPPAEREVALRRDLQARDEAIAELQNERQRLVARASDYVGKIGLLQAQVDELQSGKINLQQLTGIPTVDLVQFAKKASGLSVGIGYGGVSAFGADRGDREAARKYYESLAALAKDSGFQAGVAIALENLSLVDMLSGAGKSAAELQASAVRIAQEAGAVETPVSAYDRLNLKGVVFRNLDAAQQFHTGALSLARSSGYRWGEASANLDLGVISQAQNDFRRAKSYYDRANQIFSEDKEDVGAAMVLWNLASLYASQNDLNMAERFRREALSRLDKIAQ